MNPTLLPLAAILALLFTSCIEEKKPEMKVTPAVSEFLGPDILKLLDAPDAIQSYTLIPKRSEEGNRIGDYPIDSEGPALTDAQVATLTDVLLDEGTYNFESAKRGFHVPEYAFRIKKGTESVDLLVDLYRNEVVFLYKEETERTEDCDDARDVLLTLIKEIFPQATFE